MSLAELVHDPADVRGDVDRELTRRVLLLGNDDRVLLAVARGLGRNGISVHVAWCDPNSPALCSRYVDQFHQVVAYDPRSPSWLESLHRLVRRHDFDLVIPCNDFAVVPLQTARDQLDPEINWYLLNDQAFRVAFDKGETAQVAAELGIHLPQEYVLNSEPRLDGSSGLNPTALERFPLRFPVYVKPRSSITPSDVAHKRAAARIETPTELAHHLGADFPEDGVLIQESFSGVGIGVEVLANRGKVLMQIQHRRLRETIDGGSTYRETIAEIPELSVATRKMVSHLDYSGVGMFEYRFNLESKQWVFLEINGRFWGSIPLAIAAGANFPLALYQLLVEDRREFDSQFSVGTRCRNLVKDLRAYRQQRNSRFELFRLLLGRDHLDFFASDDPRPQFATLTELAGSALRKLFRR